MMKDEMLKGLMRTVWFLWELPQLILGFLLLFCYRKGLTYMMKYKDAYIMFSKTMPSGISLGHFIILNSRYEDSAVKNPEKNVSVNHEYGHTVQSKILGPLYLIIIGIPSLLGNVWDRLFHKSWSNTDSMMWYYNQPWEKWADKNGNVERMVKSNGTIYSYVKSSS